ncbi:MAG TPA: CapA family protein [Verrucomicrobiae bacterium]|nr:CapA family protein [Verrucomicrobiae bacterium]
MYTRASAGILWQSPGSEPVAARIAMAGDFLPSGRLALPARSSWSEMAALAAPLFCDVDTGIANLECVLDAAELVPRPLNGLGDVVSAPRGALDFLAALRLKIAGVANNHAFDFGSAGLSRTLAAVSDRGMKPLGAGRTLRDSPGVFVWSRPAPVGPRVGFWAAAKATHDPSTPYFAGVEPATLARGLKALQMLRRQGAQFCVALLHAGCLRTDYPDPEDARLIDSLASAGFDIVAASHSHRISGYRRLSAHGRHAFSFYGLGSVVSGFVSSPLESEGLVVVAGLTSHGKLASLEVRPVSLATSGWAELPTAESAERILARFKSLSRRIVDGSFAAAFYRDMSKDMFHVYWRDVRAAFRESGFRGLVRKAGRMRLRHVRRLVRAVVG